MDQQEGKAVFLTRLGELRLPEIHSYMSTFGTVVNMEVREDKSMTLKGETVPEEDNSADKTQLTPTTILGSFVFDIDRSFS